MNIKEMKVHALVYQDIPLKIKTIEPLPICGYIELISIYSNFIYLNLFI